MSVGCHPHVLGFLPAYPAYVCLEEWLSGCYGGLRRRGGRLFGVTRYYLPVLTARAVGPQRIGAWKGDMLLLLICVCG